MEVITIIFSDCDFEMHTKSGKPESRIVLRNLLFIVLPQLFSLFPI